MDEILAMLMQDNAYQEQAKFKTYPTPTVNPVNQLITSPAEADKIAEAAERKADNIMTIPTHQDQSHHWPKFTPQSHNQLSLSHPQPPQSSQRPR